MSTLETVGFGQAQHRRNVVARRARRFALVAVALGAVGLIIATGAAFTAQNATADVVISGTTGSALTVTAVRTDLTNPDPALWAGGLAEPAPPTWLPIIGQPVGTGTDVKDLVLIDARNAASTTVTITVALRNAPTLADGYSTFILPVQVRQAALATLEGITTWATADGGDTQYLTLSTPTATFTVDRNELESMVFEVVVPGGTDEGVVVAKSATLSDLQPQFLIQAN